MINSYDNIVSETKDISENSLDELDQNGNVVGLTLEHAKNIVNLNYFSFRQLATL